MASAARSTVKARKAQGRRFFAAATYDLTPQLREDGTAVRRAGARFLNAR